MQKKFLTKLTAIATAGVFAVSMPSMTVLAEEYPDGTNQITCEPSDNDIVHGDIETTSGMYAIQAQGGNGTVEGDVIDKSGNATAGVQVNGDDGGGTIVIQGSIEGFVYGIDGGLYDHNADISVGEDINARDIGIYVTNQDIAVGGDVSGGAAGIYSHNSEITVGGDVTSNGEVKSNAASTRIGYASSDGTESGIGIIADNGSNISVKGSVNAANTGIEAKYNDDLEEISEANAIVSVGSDVTAGSLGIYVDDATVTVGGDVTTTNDYSTAIEASGATVTVGDNVTAAGDESTGVNVYSSTIDIGGDVNAKEIGIFAQDSTIDVKGSVDGGTVGAYAKDKSNITIEGDVSGTAIAVGALSSTVTIIGDVTSDGSGTYKDGDLDFSGTGIATQASRVFVGGNVTAGYNGVEIGLNPEEDEYDDENEDDTDSETYVVIKGTITAENGIAIAAWDTDTADDVMNALPTLYIYQIASENPILIRNEKMDDDALSALTQTVAENINYIINSDDAITIDPTSVTNYMDFYTTRLNNAFTFTVADGYEFNTNHSDTFTTVYNETTGKWTATLTSVNGGINLTTINPNGGANEEDNNEQNQNENPDNHNGQNGNADNNNGQNGNADNNDDHRNQNDNIDRNNADNNRNNEQNVINLSADQAPSIENTGFYGAPLGAITVSSGASLANAAPAVEGAAAPSRVLSLNVSELTPAQLQTAVVDNISSTPSGGTLRIETTTASCFDQKMLETFAQKGDIDIEVLFTYGGKKLRVVIPAGYDITKLLDEKGYCGYLRLAEILGATEV
ncbi:beta strand repeat-containing protein [Butyrivibrio sp.]|jgi:hypothetical protein|uniref:beta strand repeat-containing protein n=1 Tax=Butyrivibrio sp. TaxID=28121 RepID=UPI0025BD1FE4|nr:hypothetical protein [Butyrivibrio sp.]MBE5837259.1 hypothetical protein [Butyrivibrio sp.]